MNDFMKILKKMLAVLSALVLSLTAVAASAETAPFFGSLNAEQADATIAAPADAFTEEALTSSGANILRDGEKIYMITFPASPAKIASPAEALETAGRFCPLLGAEKDLTLTYYNTLRTGTSLIYAFAQTRNDELVYGRSLKLVTDAEGNLTALFSSLAFPEETEETLGVTEEDPLTAAMEEAETPEVPAFEKMIPGEYAAEVAGTDGAPRTLKVPVMQDPDTGLYFLADPVRKIAVGDFEVMVLEKNKNCLVTAAENGGWDEEDLLFYERTIQVWDYYAALGWKGADGVSTPILLLRNLKYLTGESMENAAYIGPMGAWQSFAYSPGPKFGKSLDVVAHEFTHCVTETSLAASLYKDDPGAINEAMSDIMGNLCEHSLTPSGDQAWLVGESSGSGMRSMTSPHDYNQPEYAYDIFYAPTALHPNDLNDRGGVHTNSSLLNRIAARLCTEAGMPEEDAARFWMTVDMALLPSTDYPKIADVMEWAVDVSGCEAWREPLSRFIDEACLRRTELPDVLPDHQSVVSLTLPDTEVMKDQYWILTAIQVRTDKLLSFLKDLWQKLRDDPEAVERLLAVLEDTGTPDQLAQKKHTDEETKDLENSLSAFYSSSSTWVEAENKPLTMVVEKDIPTFFVLMNLDTTTLESRGLAICVGGEWVDLNQVFSGVEADPDSASLDDLKEAFPWLMSFVLELLLPTAVSADRVEITPAGLENLTLLDNAA